MEGRKEEKRARHCAYVYYFSQVDKDSNKGIFYVIE